MNNGCVEKELFLGVADFVINNKNTGKIAQVDGLEVDGEIFKDLLTYHGLAPFASLALKNNYHLLSQDLIKVLDASYYYSLSRVANLQSRFIKIHDAFEQGGVLLLPIKGVALIEDLYPHCPARMSADIDVLIKRQDLDKAIQIMEALGYEKDLEGLRESYWRDKQYHIVFTGKDAGKALPIVEVHWELDYPRGRAGLLPEMFNRLRDGKIANKNIKLLSVEDTFFSLVLHQRHFGAIMSLKDACDAVILLNKYGSIFDWDYVISQCRKYRLCSSVFFTLCLAQELPWPNVPEGELARLNLPVWKRNLIKDFIAESVFLPESKRNDKPLYLKGHFLLYDGFWEPVKYILNIPQEQFAKFYELEPYTKRTRLFYRFRLIYILIKCITGFCRKGGSSYAGKK